MKSYRLSRLAEQDRDDILTYTIDKFGTQQALRLLNELEQALFRLGKNPGIGYKREDILPEEDFVRFFTFLKRFVIIYEFDAESLVVLRILHGSRDIEMVFKNQIPD